MKKDFRRKLELKYIAYMHLLYALLSNSLNYLIIIIMAEIIIKRVIY